MGDETGVQAGRYYDVRQHEMSVELILDGTAEERIPDKVTLMVDDGTVYLHVEGRPPEPVAVARTKGKAAPKPLHPTLQLLLRNDYAGVRKEFSFHLPNVGGVRLVKGEGPARLFIGLSSTWAARYLPRQDGDSVVFHVMRPLPQTHFSEHLSLTRIRLSIHAGFHCWSFE